MRVLAAQLNPTIGDLDGNLQKVLAALKRAREQRIDIVVFPELVLSGYFPDDLLLDVSYIEAIQQKLALIEPHTKGLFAAIGLPRLNPNKKEKPLYNSAAIFADGKFLGFKDKTLLPTYDVYDEKRYFESGTQQPIWEYLGRRIAILICEDAWQHAHQVQDTTYQIDPVVELKEKQPDLVLNLSGSPYSYRRSDVRFSVFSDVAKTLSCPLVFCNQVGANDEWIFDGHSLYFNEKGELLQLAKGFVEQDFIVDLNTHACPCAVPETGTSDLYAALVLGVRDYFHKQNLKKALLGLSGGIDSALVACIAKDALGAENVLALTMPSRYSSKGSVEDSYALAQNLHIELKTILIESVFESYLQLLKQSWQEPSSGFTEENLQSRIRGMILMAHSNQTGALLLNTGNKSEMAMGYATLYGDMAGGLGVLQDVTKRHVYELSRYVNRQQEIIPQAIIDKAPSAELRPDQRDSDSLPPYEVLDPILEDYLEERMQPAAIAAKRKQPLELVQEIIRRVHAAEFKRRQAPIGLRVTQKAFSRGRIVPIVQKWK